MIVECSITAGLISWQQQHNKSLFFHTITVRGYILLFLTHLCTASLSTSHSLTVKTFHFHNNNFSSFRLKSFDNLCSIFVNGTGRRNCKVTEWWVTAAAVYKCIVLKWSGKNKIQKPKSNQAKITNNQKLKLFWTETCSYKQTQQRKFWIKFCIWHKPIS